MLDKLGQRLADIFNPEKDSKRLSPLAMYTGFAKDYILDGSREKAMPLSEDELQISFERKDTQLGFSRMFYVKSLPEYVDLELVARLREECKNKCSLVAVNININLDPFVMKFNTEEMQESKRIWEQNEKRDLAEISDERFSSIEEDRVRSKYQRLSDTWDLIKNAATEHHAFTTSDILIELRTVGRSREARNDLNIATANLFAYGNTMGIQVKKISGYLYDFYKYASPTSTGRCEIADKIIDKRVLTDEIVTDFMSYSQGKLMQTQVLLGMDIDSGKYVYKDFVQESAGAENLLVAAQTGCGKSYLVKALVIMLLLRRFVVIVLDRDGEYIPLAERVGGTVVSMGRDKGTYFDTVEIGDLTGDSQIDDVLYYDSRKATERSFNVMADANAGMNSDELRIFSDCYTEMLETAGAFEKDKYSWKNSVGLSYADLYKVIKGKESDVGYKERYGQVLIKFVNKLAVFFEPSGQYSNIFRHKIVVSDILSKSEQGHLIVLHLDLDDDVASKVVSKETVLKQITAQYLTNLVVNYNRKQHFFTIVVKEEFNRDMYNQYAKQVAVECATGYRKRNASFILNTNAPQELCDKSGSKDEALAAIQNSVTTAIIGRLNANVIEPVLTAFSMDSCIDVMREMLKDPETYEKVFIACIDKREYARIMAVVPPELRNSPVFGTRDKKRKTA